MPTFLELSQPLDLPRPAAAAAPSATAADASSAPDLAAGSSRTPSARALRRGRAWGSAWRVLAATLVGLVAFGATLPEDPALYSGLHLLDFLLGIVAISLLPLRRSAPLVVVADDLVLTTLRLGAIGVHDANAA